MRKITLLFVSLLLAGAQMLQAQRTITGTVIADSDKQGIPGVSVRVKGTTTGTTTDINGGFNISVPANSNVLVFSFMGMKAQEVNIDGRTTIDVVMASDALSLEGVVITGYGVSRKAAFTGAATVVSEGVVKRQTEANVINSLQGAVPGLQISNSSGQPGSASTVRLRGLGSINAGTSPLYIIDGVPAVVGNLSNWASSNSPMSSDPLAALNPEDVESISVLKDASATAIYGARASNGVIVITTKKGKEGKGTFNVSFKAGISANPQMSKKNRMLNANDYTEMMIDGDMSYEELFSGNMNYTREDAIEYLTSQKIIGTGYDTDWWDEVTRPGQIYDFTVSASNAFNKGNYFVSAGYFKDDSYVIGSGYERYSARTNAEYAPTKWLTFGVNATVAHSVQNQTSTSLATANPTFTSRILRPTEPVKNPDGTWNLSTSQGGYNPVAMRSDPNGDYHVGTMSKLTVSPYLRVQFYKNLFFQTKVSGDISILDEKQYWSATVNPQGAGMGGLTQLYYTTYMTRNITNTLNWLPSIGKNHNFNVLLGQEAQKFSEKSLYASDQAFPDYRITELLGSAKSKGISDLAFASLLSYFGNVEYDFANRYYLSASLRRDGSSRFGADNKWGTFWSVGAKWRISQESFLKSTSDWLDNLTLRASYGTTGNQDIGWYAAIGKYSTGVGYGSVNGTAPGSIGNPKLKWETKNKFNVGLEVSLFNRLSMEVDYYNEITKDMLYSTPVSRATGFTSVISNFASMSNQGVEIQLNALLVSQKNVQWTFGLNFTRNQNKVLDLGLKKPDGSPDSIIGTISMITEGLPYNVLFMKQWAGVDPETGLGYWLQADGSQGKYATAPQAYVGSSYAKFYGGFNTRVDFYGFDFSAAFFYSVGSKFYSNDARYFENSGDLGGYNANYYYFNNRWKKPGDITDVPRMVGGNYGQGDASTRWLMNGSYLRLKSLSLGYTIPKSFLQKMQMTNARIYISADNIYTFTHKDFRGFEPDAGLSGSQAGTYGQPRNFLIGINVTF